MISGERVQMRRIDKSDLPRLVVWLNDPEIREWTAHVYPIGPLQEERWLESTLGQDPALQPLALDALRPGATEWTPIGIAGFHALDWRSRCSEVGIIIGDKGFWNAGYGTAAMRTLVAWGFQELNLHRIWLKVFEANTRAVRCYEKVGFRHEGCLRDDRYHAGRYSNTLVMGLLDHEFR